MATTSVPPSPSGGSGVVEPRVDPAVGARVSRLLRLAIAVAIGLGLAEAAWLAVATVERAAAVVRYPFELDYGEGIVLDNVRALRDDRLPYPDRDAYPFQVNPYPPLYPAAVAALQPVLGRGLAAGRTVSALSALGVAVLLFWIVRRTGRRVDAALVAAFAWLGIKYVYIWAPLHRVDMLALLLGLGGLAWAVRFAGSPLVLVSVFFFLFAGYTRQTVVALPAATFWWLFVRDRRRAVTAALLYAGAGVAVFAALEWASGGQFWNNVVGYPMAEPYFLRRAAGQALKVFARDGHAPLVIAAVAGAVFSTRRRHDATSGFAGRYLALAALATLTAGNLGANFNHFLDLLLACCLATGILLAEILSGSEGSRRTQVARLGFALALVGQLEVWRRLPERAGHAPLPPAAAVEAEAALVERIRAVPGDVLSESPGLPVIAGKPLAYQAFEFHQFARAGLWDEGKILRRIEGREFDLVVLDFDLDRVGPADIAVNRFSERFLRAVGESYTQTERYGKHRVWTPRLVVAR
jgi:hypothetical protein